MSKFLFLVLMVLPIVSQAQLGNKSILPKGLRLANHMEYSFDNKRDIEILENWFQADYRNSGFFTGLRLEVFQPNDPDPSIARGKDFYGDIAYKYIGYKIGSGREFLEVTAGNFYQLIGRGLVLKSYEDRTIRVDNNLFGLRLKARYNDLKILALSGSGANMNNERKDALHALDAEYKFFNNLSAGLTLATNSSKNSDRTSIASLRLIPSFDNVDGYFEYGLKQNEAQRKLFGTQDFVGKAIYANINGYFGDLSLSGEYKVYDNFQFTSADQTVQYNTPPSLRQDYSFTLLNRHPSPLDANNEEGYQLSANYYLSEKDFLQFNYGFTNTLGSSSYFNNNGRKVQTQFKEIFTEWERDWNENIYTLFGVGYNEELQSATKNLTPVFEGRYYFGNVNTLKLSFEHQNTENWISGESYYSDFLILEYLRAPKLSVAIATEMKTTSPEENKIVRKFWGFVRFGYKLGMHTDVSLLVGSRQAGNICVGGVCRYEPEFNGVELKILSRI